LYAPADSEEFLMTASPMRPSNLIEDLLFGHRDQQLTIDDALHPFFAKPGPVLPQV
jgi:hypothetical protein